MIGGLLSAHLLATDERQPLGPLRPPGYDDELLSLAHELATRLLPAFSSPSGIPYPRVTLQYSSPLLALSTINCDLLLSLLPN